MKITAKIIYRLTIALMIAGSVQTAAKEKISLLAPYDEWYFPERTAGMAFQPS
nr:hypothetical protein [Escherichia coli]